MEKTYIYLVENCYGDPNKVYIGKEKFPKEGKKRKYNHQKIYGDQIIFTYIDEINSWDKNDWKPIETYWIHQFRTWNFEVINKNDGGGGPITHTKETREILKKLNTRPKPKPIGYSEKISKATKGIKRSLEAKNNISKALKLRKITWREKINKSLINRHDKPVLQYDLGGNFIKEWKSPKEANKSLRPNSVDATTIRAAARGNQKSALGFKWKYKNE